MTVSTKAMPVPSRNIQLRTADLTVLEEIASQLNYDAESLTIEHPKFSPLILTPDLLDRYRQLPPSSRRHYLKKQLAQFIYGAFYNGSIATIHQLSPPVNADALNNNQLIGIDLDLFNSLHAHNRGQGYWDENWCVKNIETDGAVAVTKGELTLHAIPSRHFSSVHQHCQPSEKVAVKMPKNLLQEGYYFAISNLGIPSLPSVQSQSLVRLYFNIQVEGAALLMQEITSHLNSAKLLFSFKEPYHPHNYRRYDTGVLFVQQQDYALVRACLQSFYGKIQPYLGLNVPLFTKAIAPGIGLAEEPLMRSHANESFGLNRCQLIADAILAMDDSQEVNAVKRLAAIDAAFSEVGINLAMPYLNPSSTDCYDILD